MPVKKSPRLRPCRRIALQCAEEILSRGHYVRSSNKGGSVSGEFDSAQLPRVVETSGNGVETTRTKEREFKSTSDTKSASWFGSIENPNFSTKLRKTECVRLDGRTRCVRRHRATRHDEKLQLERQNC